MIPFFIKGGILNLKFTQKYPLKFVKSRFFSFIIPDLIKIWRLRNIEAEAKKIVSQKKIPFLIRCKIKDGEGETYGSIGFSYQFEKQVEGKYDIYIYRHYLMAPKQELLKTIFHEYGHFIDYCTSKNTISSLELLYQTNKFPKSRGNFNEDFAELFAEYMLDLIKLDTDFSNKIDVVIQEGIFTLKKKNMK